MSRRKDAKALARWHNEARQWATATGRDLALDLHYDRETATRPYGGGVVLDAGEKVWAEVPVRFNLDWSQTVTGGQPDPDSRRTDPLGSALTCTYVGGGGPIYALAPTAPVTIDAVLLLG